MRAHLWETRPVVRFIRACGGIGRHAAFRTPCFGVPVRVRAGACTHVPTVHFRERRRGNTQPGRFGTHDDKTLAPPRGEARRAERVALPAHGPLREPMPITGV